MISFDYPRDLAFTAAVFGLATFIWAGWAQERPPHWGWRIVLAALTVGGLVVMGLALPPAIRHWESPTALEVGSLPFAIYVGMVAFELVAGGIAAVILIRRKRAELVAPVMLLVVALHWVPMIWVFQQPLLAVLAVWTLAAAIAAFRLPAKGQARSFWCGILTAPMSLALGVVLLIASQQAFAQAG